MAKPKTVYTCQSCGYQTPKWQGKCFECGAFDSFVESVTSAPSKNPATASNSASSSTVSPIELSSVSVSDKQRHSTGVAELDAVVGNGFITGQVVLLGGEPGVGKSTLILDVASRFNSLYVCGEESELQVKLRADRLGLNPSSIELTRELEVNTLSAYLLTLTSVQKEAVPLVIIDSIQSVYSSSLDSPPGSISQVQYCAKMLLDVAKKSGLIMVIIGQITKGGMIAGPKQLEHLVDTVLYLEGSRSSDLRVLRVIKNRFGPTDEVGVFQMAQSGMKSAEEALKELVGSRKADVAGSVLTVVMEGNRPLILEVQALNTPAQYGSVQRVVNGIPPMRAKMLLAVLERRVGIKTSNHDIYINISGGLKVDDPAVDLAACLAVASVIKDKPVPADLVAFGEVGLLGEIKPVRFADRRIKEAQKMGYTQVIGPSEGKRLRDVVREIVN